MMENIYRMFKESVEKFKLKDTTLGIITSLHLGINPKNEIIVLAAIVVGI